VELIRKLAGTCDDATCPAVWETSDPETVAIQGPHLAEPGVSMSEGEAVVLIPRTLLKGL
jgi:hypothetical protein